MNEIFLCTSEKLYEYLIKKGFKCNKQVRNASGDIYYIFNESASILKAKKMYILELYKSHKDSMKLV